MKNKLYKQIRTDLKESFQLIAENKQKYTVNETAFTRNTKLSFEKVMDIIFQFEGSTLNHELLKHYNYHAETPTASALCQKRSKIRYEAFEDIFKNFTDKWKHLKLYKNYRILAVDGSDIYIPRNEADEENYIRNTDNIKGWNCLHLNVLYDLLNNLYTDAIVMPGRKKGERSALFTMAARNKNLSESIIICDRGYESYQSIAEIQNLGGKFIFRLKEPKNRVAILYKTALPDLDEFDICYDLKVAKAYAKGTRKMLQEDGYLLISAEAFNRLQAPGITYDFGKVRILKIHLPNGNFEYLLTNLTREEANTGEVKELYHMRWGIETSFRYLKTGCSLLNFHSKKVNNIKQEIYARLILFNFASMLVSAVKENNMEKLTKGRKKWWYEISLTDAIKICRDYFKKQSPQEIFETLILKFLSPIRKNRNFVRRNTTKQPKCFQYRIS